MTSTLHLRNAGTSLVIDLSGPGAPGVAHWGADLGDLDDSALETLLAVTRTPALVNNVDVPTRPALLPEHISGWRGRPGLQGFRAGGTGWAPAFRLASSEQREVEGTQRAVLTSVAEAAELSLRTELELTPSGVLRARHVLRNDGGDPYAVESLVLALPIPTRATDLLDFAGHWARERAPQRHSLHTGTWLREQHAGRTGHDAVTLLFAGDRGLGFRRGEAWGIHLGWSGNSTVYAERTPGGEGVLAAGELLEPGELSLEPGEDYTTPWLYAVYTPAGLDLATAALHAYLRARPQHPSPTDAPRPVTLNVWEAVYFDHNIDTLRALADVAAEVGVERFVLDDGWFRHRRDDHAGLGDWYVDETVWPDGLHPLAEHLAARGLAFGLWVEPEMINPDSDLARSHPDWILGASSVNPPLARHQQVLDLGRPEAYAYIRERLDALLSDYPIGYLKWDHNRNLVGASAQTGRAGVHEQTLAVYRLMDELRARHPGVEVESCSSGGARIDYGILERTDRVWTSDNNDALERQYIQRWTGMLLPLELMGAHVGPTHSHTTDRIHDLSFRAATALFGHFGIEWDITETSPDQREELARWIALYKQLRPLLHTGTRVHADSVDPALWLSGVVATDRGHAVYDVVALATGALEYPGTQQLPGLDPALTYQVRDITPEPRPRGFEQSPVALADPEGITLPGHVLTTVGLALPLPRPEHALILEARAL